MASNFAPWLPGAGDARLADGDGVFTETTLAALDQVCWHLLCCEFLFDVIEEASDVKFHQVAADLEQARFKAETLFQNASQRYRTDPSLSTHRPANPAVPEHTGAGAFLGAFERQFDGDSPVVSGGTSWPTCQDVRGKNGSRRCNRPALYLGEGQWSLSCDKHARRTDREHHERWGDTRRTSLDYDCCQRTRQRQAIGRAVLDWWRETGGPLTAIRSAVDHAGTQD